MPDYIPEEDFHDTVYEKLKEYFPASRVVHESYIPETYQFPDFVVHHPMFTLVVEVENDSDSVVEGVGQAETYSTSFENSVAAVVSLKVPEPEGEQLRMRSDVLVHEWDYQP